MKSFLDFEEKNVDKAVQKACEELNVSREKLKFDIISHGSSGIFGLVGTKKALIRVFVPDLPKAPPASSKTDSTSLPKVPATESEMAQADRDTVSALVDEAFGESQPSIAPPPSKKSRKPRKNQKSEKIASDAKEKRDEKKQKIETAEPPDQAEITEPRDEPDQLCEDSVTDEEWMGDAPASVSPADVEAALAVARELAEKVFIALDLAAEISLDPQAVPPALNVKVPDPGILIGKRGQTLEAIQYLVDKVVNKQCGKGSRVIVDVEGYVETRKTELKELATRLANKTLKSGKPSTMMRMNAHDRRIVHIALKRNPAVRTQSVGDGYYRKLIIFPKKKTRKKAETPKPTE